MHGQQNIKKKVKKHFHSTTILAHSLISVRMSQNCKWT